jgi:hypothetical protein
MSSSFSTCLRAVFSGEDFFGLPGFGELRVLWFVRVVHVDRAVALYIPADDYGERS